MRNCISAATRSGLGQATFWLSLLTEGQCSISHLSNLESLAVTFALKAIGLFLFVKKCSPLVRPEWVNQNSGSCGEEENLHKRA